MTVICHWKKKKKSIHQHCIRKVRGVEKVSRIWFKKTHSNCRV